MICKSISKFKNYLRSIKEKNIKNILRTADLAFMYIQYKYKFSEEEIYTIISKINKKYFYDIPNDKRKSKIIDLYKANEIVNMIEDIIFMEKKEVVKC